MKWFLPALLVFVSSFAHAQSDVISTCAQAPSFTITPVQLSACMSECRAQRLGLTQQIVGGTITDEQQVNNTTCFNVRKQADIQNKFDSISLAVENIHAEIESIASSDLGGDVAKEAAYFFSKENFIFLDEIAPTIQQYVQLKGSVPAPGLDYADLFPLAGEEPSDLSGIVATPYADEIDLYQENLDVGANELQGRCLEIQNLAKNSHDLKTGDLYILQQYLNVEPKQSYSSIKIEQFMALQHRVHSAAARAKFLEQVVQDDCRRSTIPCIDSAGGILPGRETCGNDAALDTNIGWSYIVDRFLPGAANFFLVFVTVISVVGVLIGGMMYITSAFDVELQEKAKNTIAYSLGGLVLAMLAYFIVRFFIGLSLF